VAKVWLAVDVINGGGDVKRFAHPGTVWWTPRQLAIRTAKLPMEKANMLAS
jgi:uncharacterized protein (AIM24 family)